MCAKSRCVLYWRKILVCSSITICSCTLYQLNVLVRMHVLPILYFKFKNFSLDDNTYTYACAINTSLLCRLFSLVYALCYNCTYKQLLLSLAQQADTLTEDVLKLNRIKKHWCISKGNQKSLTSFQKGLCMYKCFAYVWYAYCTYLMVYISTWNFFRYIVKDVAFIQHNIYISTYISFVGIVLTWKVSIHTYT